MTDRSVDARIPRLPFTGWDAGTTLAVGAALAALGAIAVMGTRRRRAR